MTGTWGVLAGVVSAFLGASALLASGLFAARATKAAARTTAEAQRYQTQMAAEPAQRAADLAAFQAIRDDMQHEIDNLKAEALSLRSLVRAFTMYVSDLTAQMRTQHIEPPDPPERVKEYNRTGV
jgi:hypothetical protein